MALENEVFVYSAAHLWATGAIFCSIALLQPLWSLRQKGQLTLAKLREKPKTLLLRIVLLVLLLPPFFWAASEGRYGASITRADTDLTGIGRFGAYLGRANLERGSLRLIRRNRLLTTEETLISSLRGEHLRIDGFFNRSGESLSAVVRQKYQIPVEISP